jgi:hemerythrin-like domain-containing protein
MQRDPSLIPLSHDHHHALSLCVLTRRSLGADSSPENLAAQAAVIIEKFDTDLRRHFDLEEQILFPALGAFDAMRELIAELLEEHSRLAGYVDSLRANSDARIIEEFCSLLQLHVRKEESRLFETAQKLLSRDQLDDLGNKLSHSPHSCSIPRPGPNVT